MVIHFPLSQSDIESLLSISKLLKCDKILYDRNYVNPIIGVGPEKSYFQTKSFMVDLSPHINNLLVNISDLKNISKITQLEPAKDNPEIAIHKPVVSVFNWDAEYVKACMNSLREYQIDDNIIARTDEFHNTEYYNELMAGSASTGASRISVGGVMIISPKPLRY